MFDKATKFLAPNDLGTRALLAVIIIWYGLPKIPVESLKEVLMLVVVAYFVNKAANGAPKP
jgi:hypothetical protein